MVGLLCRLSFIFVDEIKTDSTISFIFSSDFVVIQRVMMRI